MGATGERINNIGRGKTKSFILKDGDEEFNLVFDLFLPEAITLEASNYGDQYAADMEKTLSRPLGKAEEQRINSTGMIKFYASVGFKDEDGEQVWDSPEDVNTSGIIFPQIQNFILREVLGFLPGALDEKDVKK